MCEDGVVLRFRSYTRLFGAHGLGWCRGRRVGAWSGDAVADKTIDNRSLGVFDSTLRPSVGGLMRGPSAGEWASRK